MFKFFLLKHKNPKCKPLTAEELAFFNGDEFFNGAGLNIRNQFLSSLYSSPEDIDLYRLFYYGSGLDKNPITDDEKIAVINQNGWNREPQGQCEKNSLMEIDDVLKRNIGLTLANTKHKGLNNLTFPEQYNAYYHYRDDTNYRRSVFFYTGIMMGNLVRLFYNDEFYGDGEKILTLKKLDDGFFNFVSNEMKLSPVISK